MKHTVKAEVCWLPPEAGGRQQPPSVPTYSTVAKFAEYADRWPEEAWSIVVDLSGANGTDPCVIAEVRFLAQDAPSHLLRPGEQFELYEGDNKVADVMVLA